MDQKYLNINYLAILFTWNKILLLIIKILIRLSNAGQLSNNLYVYIFNERKTLNFSIVWNKILL